MNTPPQPSTNGQIIGFYRKLYEELLDTGNAHLEILKLSVTKALLKRYGSPEAIDEALGEGTYKGVQQVHGKLVSWRKAWTTVKREQNARYLARQNSLDALMDSVDECMKAGATEADILKAVHKVMDGVVQVTALRMFTTGDQPKMAYSS